MGLAGSWRSGRRDFCTGRVLATSGGGEPGQRRTEVSEVWLGEESGTQDSV